MGLDAHHRAAGDPSGEMIAVAFTLSARQRAAVAAYLGTSAAPVSLPAAAFCVDRTVRLPGGPLASWNGWSPAADNARFQPASAARLSIAQVRRLKLKWAFGFAGDSMAFAPPTVIGDELFVGSAGGVVHALLFGDLTGRFYALNAETGQLLWKVWVATHDSARLTGGPAVYQGTVFVPVASWEETRSGAADYACCTFRGSVVALRIRDGHQLWRTWMTGVPSARGSSVRATVSYGPSGATATCAPTPLPPASCCGSSTPCAASWP
ncbi:MAG: PQQ-binding-like beta-propeller repeat protein [Steroidobacteraceae bacterium]